MTDTLALARKIRRHAVEMTHLGKSSHVGSVMSMTDVIAVLYGSVMRFDPSNPRWDGRDRFILSKGHAGAGVYAALAESGFFSTERLRDHYQDGSIFSGHVSHKEVPGVEFSTVRWGTAFRLPVAWPKRRCSMASRTGFSACSVMANATKDPTGRRRCLPPIISCATWSW